MTTQLHVVASGSASARPLYVTAIGMDMVDAARAIARMHGAHRVPSLLKRVDALARACL